MFAPDLRLVTGAAGEACRLVEAFTERYTNRITRNGYRRDLTQMFAMTGATHPTQLTEAAVFAWCTTRNDGRLLANNSARARKTALVSFLRWCQREGIACLNPEVLTSPDSPLRNYTRPTAGKVQGHYPARWLNHDEAFVDLIDACRSDEKQHVALRDEIVIRLGLTGMRASEIADLTVGCLTLDGAAPCIRWIGKQRRPRQITPGTQLVSALRRWLDAYPDAHAGSPVICPQTNARFSSAGTIDWGSRVSYKSVHNIVTARARQARLGHVAPHDLRRSAAGILHAATADNGAHFFDLLDIQRVLGHADPATTMKHYLNPMDNGAQDRASKFLDG